MHKTDTGDLLAAGKRTKAPNDERTAILKRTSLGCAAVLGIQCKCEISVRPFCGVCNISAVRVGVEKSEREIKERSLSMRHVVAIEGGVRTLAACCTVAVVGQRARRSWLRQKWCDRFLQGNKIFIMQILRRSLACLMGGKRAELSIAYKSSTRGCCSLNGGLLTLTGSGDEHGESLSLFEHSSDIKLAVKCAICWIRKRK